MAVRRTNVFTGTRRRTAKPAAPAPVEAPARTRKPVRKAAPAAKAPARPDVTAYATKAPTGYHKAFAKWIVEEVGYDPSEARSARAAFLMGVSIATAARPAFNSSEAVEEYREKSGEAKRGPKPAAAAKAAPASRRRKAEPEPVEEDEFDDEEEFDDETDSEEDDEFDDDESDEDESDEDESDEDDEFDDEEDEEEEPPAPVRKTRTTRQASGTATTRKAGAPAKKAAPAKATRRTAKPAEDDDEFVF